MSKYEWERGEIIIPTDQWVAFRRKIIEAHNAEQERLFALATLVLSRARELARGKRGLDWKRTVETLANDLNTEKRDWDHDQHEVTRLLGMNDRYVTEGGQAKLVPGSKKPRAPKRKDLDIRPVRGGTNKPIESDEGRITFDEKAHTVYWRVSENNRARDTARAHPVGRAFFRALDAVTWKRGSGGKIVGNDEYNRGSDEDGGGANYVTAEYGPHVAKPRPRFSW